MTTSEKKRVLPRRRVLVAIPSQRVKAGDIGTVHAEFLISQTYTMCINGRFVTLRADETEMVEAPE